MPTVNRTLHLLTLNLPEFPLGHTSLLNSIYIYSNIHKYVYYSIYK